MRRQYVESSARILKSLQKDIATSDSIDIRITADALRSGFKKYGESLRQRQRPHPVDTLAIIALLWHTNFLQSM
jgi:hypothetical protein